MIEKTADGNYSYGGYGYAMQLLTTDVLNMTYVLCNVLLHSEEISFLLGDY